MLTASAIRRINKQISRKIRQVLCGTRATSDPRIETVKKIADALGVGIDDLMK